MGKFPFVGQTGRESAEKNCTEVGFTGKSKPTAWTEVKSDRYEFAGEHRRTYMKIYNVGNRVMNTYLYRIKDGYVMIDTGYENSYQKCTSSMKRQGISWDDVKYIFLTHAHDDHAGFLKEVLDKHLNITCIISDKAFSVLAKGQNSFNGGQQQISFALLLHYENSG